MLQKQSMLLHELILMMHIGTEWELRASHAVGVLDPEEG